ncbi:MAG: ABC transporter ATP-binding protein [Sulfolobales archaeon]
MKIELKNVSFGYDSVRAIDKASLEVDGGKILCLVGPNGSGKTTLLKLIASLIKPEEGVIYLDGKDLRKYNLNEIAKILSYSDPHLPRTLPMRVIDFILTSRYPFHRAFQYFESKDDLELIDILSKELGISHLLDRRLDQLSSGELQRVVIAAALAKKPRVLLLDEPSAFLDVRYRFEVMDMVKRYVTKYSATSIVALHDINIASLYCDNVALLNKGKVVAYGPPIDVFSSKVVEEVYGVKVEIIRVGSYYVAFPLPICGSQQHA